MTAVLKASDWLNGQLSSIMQLYSREALCMEYHVCTSIIQDSFPGSPHFHTGWMEVWHSHE